MSKAPDLIYITEGLSMKPDYPWGLWHAIPPKPDLPAFRRADIPWLPEDLVEVLTTAHKYAKAGLDVPADAAAELFGDILNAVKGRGNE